MIRTFLRKLKALSEITQTLVQQPRRSLQLLRMLPTALRGFNYSQEWRPGAARHTRPAFAEGEASACSSNFLESYFNAHKEGKGIWKWGHYFDVYHRHFSKFVGREVHVLEVGVYSGGSLEMWRQYFGPKCHIYGVDIEEACKAYENEYTKIFVGDQADRKFWTFCKEQVPAIDILIDDGGHQPEQQIVTLEEMLPHLRTGGVYLCEDVEGVRNWFTAYTQGLVNALNAVGQGTRPAFSTTEFQTWIRSIHFYPFVTVIEKVEIPAREFLSLKHGTEWKW